MSWRERTLLWVAAVLIIATVLVTKRRIAIVVGVLVGVFIFGFIAVGGYVPTLTFAALLLGNATEALVRARGGTLFGVAFGVAVAVLAAIIRAMRARRLDELVRHARENLTVGVLAFALVSLASIAWFVFQEIAKINADAAKMSTPGASAVTPPALAYQARGREEAALQQQNPRIEIKLEAHDGYSFSMRPRELVNTGKILDGRREYLLTITNPTGLELQSIDLTMHLPYPVAKSEIQSLTFAEGVSFGYNPESSFSSYGGGTVSVNGMAVSLVNRLTIARLFGNGTVSILLLLDGRREKYSPDLFLSSPTTTFVFGYFVPRGSHQNNVYVPFSKSNGVVTSGTVLVNVPQKFIKTLRRFAGMIVLESLE